MATGKANPKSLLQTFATAVRAKFAIPMPGREEDQLRRPVDELLEAIGKTRDLTVVAKDESTLTDKGGRPDFAVAVDRLLCGYVELKAPGTGADPRQFKGHNLKQWQRFQQLPNLIYTDGNDWTLVRSGQILRKAAFRDDITESGAKAVTDAVVKELSALLLDFFSWEPIVPKSAKELSAQLAPMCRMLRDDVLDALKRRSDAMLAVARDWRRYLFPEASNEVLADSYAQTVVFALLLARSDGSDTLFLDHAIKTLTGANTLLSRALEVLTDPQLSDDIGASVGLLQRIIKAVPTGTMSRGRRDPWLHFYEDFLAEYDPELRKDVGAYYTPVEVVQAQVKLVDDLLQNRFGRRLGFADGDVATLDPAVGTGTYLLGIVEHALDHVRRIEGPGAVAGRAESLVKQIFGFEIMVGPYAVAALRLTRMIHDYGAKVPRQGVGICLTNTLESPHEKIPELPLLYRPIGEEHKRARAIKELQPILVCIGNPPYDRHEAASDDNRMMTGAWVRWGEDKEGSDAILNDFSNPVRTAGKGVQLKNLYNLYVYFWRWALWKVFEHDHPAAKAGPGIVTYISASSYLDGDAFLGMREHLRRICDEIWIIDLGGEGRGTRQEENVFNIITPVAIAIAVRYGEVNPNVPAIVHYCRLEGDRKAKLARLDAIESFSDLTFAPCPTDWQSPFRPRAEAVFFDWPLITDVMPWQTSGSQVKRTWPIATTQEVLNQRWNHLLASGNRAELFKETRDRKISTSVDDISRAQALTPLEDVREGTRPPVIVRYGYRSFDRQWLMLDNRLGDYLRPSLWKSVSSQQLFFASLFSQPLGFGPALTVSPYVPDLDFFRGSYGAKNILPLYRDSEATHPNIHPQLLRLLSQAFHREIDPLELAAYLYAVLAQPAYTSQFAQELQNREVRVPVTLDQELFDEAVTVGRRLIYLHTYGERCAEGQRWPTGRAKCVQAVIEDATLGLPETFAYDPGSSTLRVGNGEFKPVSPAIWDFEVSGLKVVQSWLAYRMKSRKGRKSSALDAIVPAAWSSEFTTDLIRLLHLLEATLDSYPQQRALLDGILAGPLLMAAQLGKPSDAYRKSPDADEAQHSFDM